MKRAARLVGLAVLLGNSDFNLLAKIRPAERGAREVPEQRVDPLFVACRVDRDLTEHASSRSFCRLSLLKLNMTINGSALGWFIPRIGKELFVTLEDAPVESTE